MIKLLLFLIFCHFSFAEQHLLKVYFTGSAGLSDFPEIEVVVEVDGSQLVYCDGTKKVIKLKHDLVKKLFDDHPLMFQWATEQCFQILPFLFKTRISALRESFKQPEGVHILQRIDHCSLDGKTGEIVTSTQYGYDGEDFISLDLKALIWIALKQQAVPTKLAWDTDKSRMNFYKMLLTQNYPEWLKGFLHYGKDILLRTELPSVSLLQKLPSSPITCHATGFYPNRAEIFWRKDGEQTHEFVDYGETLLNNDGTFQMSVDLNISSISLDEWKKYDCMFMLSDTDDQIVIQLDKGVIKTNWEEPSNISIPIVAAVAALAVIASAAGCVAYRKRKAPEVLNPLRSIQQPNQPEFNNLTSKHVQKPHYGQRCKKMDECKENKTNATLT